MISRFYENNKDLSLVLGMIAILVILFAPIPSVALDLAIIANLGFALSILMLTFYVTKPVDFSTFPSLLLVTTLFRLSLNVAATRLILTGADAGDVINAIGSFAVQGNFVVGLVVFIILVVVQYVVITNGAQRVSEVAARFTLDSMPGQQMSIDADLNMGLIDQATALKRREGLAREAAFYGAMDGASKFVKGDAIAGIIILLIDIIAGWIIGVTQMDMSWSQALERFTLLTIGDGIATQFPALIISVATGIIVTRSGADKELSSEIFKQLASIPRVPVVVGLTLLGLLLLPGMPKWPIVLIVGVAGTFWWRARRQAAAGPATDDEAARDSSAPGTASIEIAVGDQLSAAWADQQPQLLDRIAALRSAHEADFGVPLPAVRFVDGKGLGSNEYEIRLLGTRHGSGELMPDMVMALAGAGEAPPPGGRETVDPAFGLKAWWITPDAADDARGSGLSIIDPATVLITHLAEIVRAEAPQLLTRAAVTGLLDGVRSRQPGLVEEILPNLLAVADVQRVLQNLLAEGVSVANVDLILEILSDLARTTRDPTELTELVRQRLAQAICNRLQGRHRDLAVLSLDPRLENQIVASIGQASGQANASLVIEPRLAEGLLRRLAPASDAMFSEGRAPVLLCAAEARRQIKALTRRAIPRLSVISVNELPPRINLRSFRVVSLEG